MPSASVAGENGSQTHAPDPAPGAAPLLATKLFIPPVRPSLVPRPRLTRRLDAGLALKLILISAPAGSGKTTLLSHWCNTPLSSNAPFAWVSLDEGDNDPARFWSYVVAALQRMQPGIGEALRELFRAGQSPPAEMAMTFLVNDLASLPQDCLLVLDDYHVIHTESIHQALIYLLDHLPSQMHLAIASRVEPPFPLSRLRGRGQMVEVNAADLRFTAEEAASFLKQMMGLELSPEQVVALEARTEGWIAGLQMAALSLQRLSHSGELQAAGPPDISAFIDSFSGGHRYIVDYLVNEVLQRQPQEIQEFLLQTSVLNRLCGPLCDALTGRGDGQAMLQRLEAANLFIVPLDEERHWYRYHHLFAEVLRKQLQQARPGLVPGLHRRASTWYEQHTLIGEAIEHALAAGEFETAIRLLGEHWNMLFFRGELPTVHKWLEALPETLVHANPSMCLRYAEVLQQVNLDFDEIARYLQYAQEALDRAAPDMQTRHLRGQLATRRIFAGPERNDLSQALAQYHLALEYLARDDPKWLYATIHMAFIYMKFGEALAAERLLLAAEKPLNLSRLTNGWSVCLVQRGRLVEALAAWQEMRNWEQQMRPRISAVPVATSGWGYIAEAKALYECNRLEAAVDLALQGTAILEQWQVSLQLSEAYHLLARIYRAQGDLQRTDGVRQADASKSGRTSKSASG